MEQSTIHLHFSRAGRFLEPLRLRARMPRRPLSPEELNDIRSPVRTVAISMGVNCELSVRAAGYLRGIAVP